MSFSMCREERAHPWHALNRPRCEHCIRRLGDVPLRRDLDVIRWRRPQLSKEFRNVRTVVVQPLPRPATVSPRSRREFLKAAGCGFGLLGPGGSAGARVHAPRAPAVPLAPRAGPLPAKAKRCIFLFMTGGPSQMDLFDPKPLLNRLDCAAPAAQLRQDPQPVSRGRPALPGQPSQVGQVWPVGNGHVGPRPAPAPPCRRHRADPLVLCR